MDQPYAVNPWQKPSFSPASIAGLVNMILSISLFNKALTAITIAKYVFPVPAGPIAKTISDLLIASMYSFWPIVFTFIFFPRKLTCNTSSYMSLRFIDGFFCNNSIEYYSSCLFNILSSEVIPESFEIIISVCSILSFSPIILMELLRAIRFTPSFFQLI